MAQQRGWIDVNTQVGPEVGRASGAPPDLLARELAAHGVGRALVHSAIAIHVFGLR